MPQQQQSPIQVENNFIGGLKTEATGLNFPENACTATENCVFSLIGDVTRREGIDYELNFTTAAIDRTLKAIQTFTWTNAGGDGNTKLLVRQVGSLLSFYTITAATITSPLSTQLLVSTVDMTAFQIVTSPAAVECQFATGNGYLFVFNPNCNPFFCTYSAGTITPALITIQIRDFAGTSEAGSPSDTFRPTVLNSDHLYNLQNQGWTSAAVWTASSGSNVAVFNGSNYTIPVGLTSFTVAAGISGVSIGQAVTIEGFVNIFGGQNLFLIANGLVNSYSGTTLIINVTATGNTGPPNNNLQSQSWSIFPSVQGGQVTTWHSAIGNYPSNSDVWWTFKNSSGVFDPATTLANITLSSPAPKGSYILQAFNQQRSNVSGATGIADVVTNIRPKTGTWFQGRVWYSGVDDGQIVAGTATSWSENIYFSQIAVKTEQFSRCYQTNDPTSETLADLLPSDGGVITIQGSGSIYKLFSITNGLLVFAANGVWFITGNTGIGFTATDYSVVKIAGVQSISGTSFIDVNGLPMFWNEEGIYEVTPTKAGSGNKTNEQQALTVQPLTVGTILTFFNSIPLQSKKFARGDYNPLTYVVKWVYRSTNESNITSRYSFDSVLNFNLVNKAFYPYQVTGTPFVHDVIYIPGTGGANAPLSNFKYLASGFSSGSYNFTFAEENNSNFLDWQAFDGTGVSFTSFFTTGYKLQGQAMNKFQPQYIRMYSRDPSTYKIQGIWEYATNTNTGKYSTQQIIYNTSTRFQYSSRRIKIRGHGRALQLNVTSMSGLPFDIIGWAVMNDVDTGD